MAEVTGVVHGADNDYLIVLSAGLISHFNIKVRKLNRICRTIFSSVYRICHLNYMLVLCGC